MCNSRGIICDGDEKLNPAQREIAEITNKEHKSGSLADAFKGADIFIGVSAPGIVTEEMVTSMAENPIVLPMANPVPEILPDKAKPQVPPLSARAEAIIPTKSTMYLRSPESSAEHLTAELPK